MLYEMDKPLKLHPNTLLRFTIKVLTELVRTVDIHRLFFTGVRRIRYTDICIVVSSQIRRKIIYTFEYVETVVTL